MLEHGGQHRPTLRSRAQGAEAARRADHFSERGQQGGQTVSLDGDVQGVGAAEPVAHLARRTGSVEAPRSVHSGGLYKLGDPHPSSCIVGSPEAGLRCLILRNPV